MAGWGLFVVVGGTALGIVLLRWRQASGRRRGDQIREWGATHGLDFQPGFRVSALPFRTLPYFRAARFATAVRNVAWGPDLWLMDTRRSFSDSEDASVESQTVVVCRIPGGEVELFRADARELLSKAGDATAPRAGLVRLHVEGGGCWVLVFEPRRIVPIEDVPDRVAQARAIAAASAAASGRPRG